MLRVDLGAQVFGKCNLGVFSEKLDCAIEMLRGCGGFARLHQNQPEAHARGGKVGVDRNRLLKLLARRFCFSGTAQRLAKRVMRVGRARSEADSFREMREGVRVFSILRQYASEQQPCIGIAGIRLDDLLEQLDRPAPLAPCKQVPRIFNGRPLRERQARESERGEVSHEAVHVRHVT